MRVDNAATVVRLAGRPVGIVRPRGPGYEAVTAGGGILGIFDTQFAAAKAVITVERHQQAEHA